MVFVARARREKNAGEKSYKFFREGYVYNVYACQQLEDFHVRARCYRSLRKSTHEFTVTVKSSKMCEQFVFFLWGCTLGK